MLRAIIGANKNNAAVDAIDFILSRRLLPGGLDGVVGGAGVCTGVFTGPSEGGTEGLSPLG